MNKIANIVFNLKIANEKFYTIDLITHNSYNGNILNEKRRDADIRHINYRRNFDDGSTIKFIDNFSTIADALYEFMSSDDKSHIGALLLIHFNTKNKNLINEYTQDLNDLNTFFNLSIDNGMWIPDGDDEYYVDTMLGLLLPDFRYIICMKPIVGDNRRPELIMYDYDDNYIIKPHTYEPDSANEIDSYISMLSLVQG